MGSEQSSCPDSPPQVPGWVVTFADLMSLLLAFFVLLFSFSEMDAAKYKQIAGSMHDAFGVQRSVPVKEPPKGVNIIAREFSPGAPVPTPLDTVRQMTTEDYHESPMAGEGGEGEGELSQGDDSFQRHAQKVKQVLKEEIGKGLVEVEVEDKKIILRIQEKGSFPSGSSDLIEPFRQIADKITIAFADVPGDVMVAGHTDNVPIHNDRFRSNWELSASRAVTIIHELSKSGRITQDRFKLMAMGETAPLDSNDTVEGRARNRRVEVTLVYGQDLQGSASPGGDDH